MNTIRVRGWALIACALHDVFVVIMLGFFGGLSLTVPFAITEIIYAVLLVIGISAVQATQPQTKRWGRVGLLFMALYAISLLSYYLPSLTPSHPRIQSLLRSMSLINPLHYLAMLAGFRIMSFFAEFVGYLIIGWVTIKTKVFPVWIGWVLILSGILYFASRIQGHYYSPSGWSSIYIFAVLIESIAFVGYGWYILQQRIRTNARNPDTPVSQTLN
jgi:hypothetical protein